MDHRLLLSVAAAALIAGGAAHAQSPSTGSTGATGGSTAPSVGQSSPSPSGAGAAQTQRSESDRSGASREAPSADRSGGNDRDRNRAMQRGSDDDRDSDRDTRRGADNDRDRDRDKHRGADNDRDKRRGADNDRDRDRSSATTGQAGARAKLSGEQRSKITTVIKNQHIEPQTNVNFSVSVGTRVPRDVRFYSLPAEIVTIYPDWRGYQFFRVRDEIVVVDPQTLEIVAVLDD